MTRLSLQTKLFLFVFAPTVLINVLFAGYGFLHARETLINLWTQGAEVQMQLVAAEIDTRLGEIRSSIKSMVAAESCPDGMLVRAFEAVRLLNSPGVLFLDIVPAKGDEAHAPSDVYGRERDLMAPSIQNTSNAPLHKDLTFRTRVYPSYDRLEVEAVAIGGSVELTRYVVYIKFSSLIKSISNLGMWEQGKALLMTADGMCLASTDPKDKCGEYVIGGAGSDPLELMILEQMKQRDAATLFGEGRPPSLIMGFQKVPSTNFYVAFMAKGCNVCKPMLRFRFYYVLAGLLGLAGILAIVVVSTRSVVRVIKSVVENAEKVEKGDYTVKLKVDRGDEIGKLQRSFNKMVDGLRRTQFIQETFGRYMDRTVAEELLNFDAQLEFGGQEKTVTILKTDLRGFTNLTSKMTPTQVVTLVNLYLSTMISVIEAHRGIIVDFYGDGILVFFDGPTTDIRGRARAAVRCAVAMQKALSHITLSNRVENSPKLIMGIGIHTDKVIVGNIGSERRAKYGIVGVGVNFVDRLQSLAVNGGILLSRNTYNLVADIVSSVRTIRTPLNGFEGIQTIFEVVDVADAPASSDQAVP
ncbi:MAG: adenylate/guanylate cyclase domain-containing protein [Desulfomonilaceae bacterium]